MSRLTIETEQSVEGRVLRIADRPIRFESFVEIAEGHHVELVGGVIVEKSVVQFDHDRCTAWMYQVIGPYVERRGLGLMLSSRMLVEVDEFGGRMPDLLFVRQDRFDIVRQRADFGAPDLVIEVASPNDRLSDRLTLEADYIRMGVPEIVFIDRKLGSIRFVRRRDGKYIEETIGSGPVRFETIGGLVLDASWILGETRPDVYDTLTQLFHSSE